MYPKNFARFYDVIYHQQRDGVDNDFFQKEIRKTRGKILEIGVGTGRMFTDALEQGSDIYGIDISPSMIDILGEKLSIKQRDRISLQNMLDFSFDFSFDLIIAPFRVFMHLPEKDEQLRALNHVFSFLNPNGRFIFDTFVPNLPQLINGIDNLTDFEGEYEPGRKIKRTVSTQPDLLQQIIHIHFQLTWEEENGEKQDSWDMTLRYFFRFELEHLIERSDFQEYTILGDYQGNPLNQDSKDFIVIGEKN